MVRPLLYAEVRARTLMGRDQITEDGRHLLDGIAFGRPALRTPTNPGGGHSAWFGALRVRCSQSPAWVDQFEVVDTVAQASTLIGRCIWASGFAMALPWFWDAIRAIAGSGSP